MLLGFSLSVFFIYQQSYSNFPLTQISSPPRAIPRTRNAQLNSELCPCSVACLECPPHFAVRLQAPGSKGHVYYLHKPPHLTQYLGHSIKQMFTESYRLVSLYQFSFSMIPSSAASVTNTPGLSMDPSSCFS